MSIQNIKTRWLKISNPIKYCFVFIVVHWAVLFPIAYFAGGHPPAVYALIELPTIILMQILQPNGPVIEPIFFIGMPTITYGFLGFLFGIYPNKKKRNKTVAE